MKKGDKERKAPYNPQFPQPQNIRILSKCYSQTALSEEEENHKIAMCISK